MINVFEPRISNEELEATQEVLSTLWLGKGRKVAEFESKWAEHCGTQARNIVTCNTCTNALFEAVRLADVSEGDEVIIPDNHFIGTAQAVYAAGATPVFCDIELESMNASNESLQSMITEKTRAIILNHYGGLPCKLDYDAIPRHIAIIHDLANAPMAKIDKGQRMDYCTWSFDAMKIITMGSGGALYCHDPQMAELARSDFNLGMDSKSGFSSNKKKCWWEFNVDDYGMRNDILNDLQAAMGLVQLKKIAMFVARRKEIVELYRELLQDIPQVIPPSRDVDPYYFFWVSALFRDSLAAYLKESEIYTTFRYYPLSLAYHRTKHPVTALSASRNNLLLPLHQGLKDDQISLICSKIMEFYRKR